MSYLKTIQSASATTCSLDKYSLPIDASYSLNSSHVDEWGGIGTVET